MKKAYLYNNYVVIEDGTNTFLFNIYNSFTVVNANDYTVQSAVGNRAVILIADATNWYDETGTIPFDADSLLLFLETYTGQFPQPTSSNGLPIGGTAGQILAKIDATNFNAEWIDNLLDEVNPVCKLGENISKGQAVYISGADGTNKVIKKASNATELTSSKTFGLLSASGVTNNKIRVITTGYLSGLNTSSANEGDPVWLGVNGNLIYGYVNKPHAPAHLVFIGFVVRKNNVNGQIYVRVQNGFELDEIHDVKIQSLANKNTLFYNSSNSLWENRLIGITDVTDLESALSGKEPTINAGTTSQYWRGDKSWQTLNKSAVGLGNVDNTSDLNKPISTATQMALNAKQDSATAINTSNIGAQSVAYAASAGNADTLDGYHASAFQMALTNPITGTGTLNYIAKFGSSSTIENSQIYDNGFQVGVGLTNPSSRFHVNGLSILTNPSGDNYNENLRLPQAAGGYASIALGGPVATVGTSVQQWTILKDPSNNFRIRHFGTDHLFINSDGNVGLGTTNPNDKFHVVGGIYSTSIGNPINGSIGAIQVGYDGTNGRVRTWNSSPLIYTSYNYQSWETTGSERMRITAGGNVGIGTTNPFRQLDVNGSLRLQTGTIDFDNSVNNQIWLGSNNLYFKTNGSEKFVITSGGNVGIGTTNPNYTLDVNGFIGATRLYPANSNNTYITGDGNAGMAVVGSGYFYVTAVGGSYFQKEVRFRNIISNDTGAYLQINGGTTGATYFAGTIRVGTQNQEPSAILHLESTTQGFLPPRMNDAEMNSISSPPAGLMVWNNDIGSIFVFDGGSWRKIAYA